VRDFFHYCDNYVDAIDRAAERFAGAGDPEAAARALFDRQGITVELADTATIRGYDAARRGGLSCRTAPRPRRGASSFSTRWR
jgi:XRE family transcriptional regulator, fatty acid utilization regulator